MSTSNRGMVEMKILGLRQEESTQNIEGGMHGSATMKWDFNVSSYASRINNGLPVSRIVTRISMDTKKLKKYITKELCMQLLVSSEENILDNEIDAVVLKKALGKSRNRGEHIILSRKHCAYVSMDKKMFISMLSDSSYDSDKKSMYEVTNDIELCYLHPYHSDAIEEIMRSIIKRTYSQQKYEIDLETPVVGILCSSGEGLEVKTFDIEKNVKIMEKDDMEAHYGKGFHDFHSSVLEILKSDDNGLIILHGSPGTGKTQYVRFLISQLASSEKSVVYIPSNLVDMFMDPSFMGFLNDWIIDKNNRTVLLLEDAESLIESRESGTRSQGISNLLNVTDGILNDILGTQIIITFNTGLEYIDQALLRPGRLLARKEFTELDLDQAKNLIDYLGITDLDAREGMTIAEIYTHKNKRKTIEHNVKKRTSKLGF